MQMILFQSKLRAFLLHLSLSAIVGALAAALVLGLWFPYPYREMAGGFELFLLVFVVDICCGPLLTFVVFNSAKPRAELLKDLSVIAVMQLAALIYGIYVVSVARPVYLVFEVDRYRIVSVADIELSELENAQADLQQLSFTGPKLISVRVPRPGDEDFVRAVELGIQGIEISFQPKYWVPYSTAKGEVLKRTKSIDDLKQKNPDRTELILSEVKKIGLTESALGYIPLQGRTPVDWVALIDQSNANIVGFVKASGF